MTVNWPYLLGLAQGMGAAHEAIPKYGESHYTEKFGSVITTEKNITDVHALIAHEQSKLWRLRSPMFRHIAEALNSLGEEAWAEFERGVRDSVIEEVLTFNSEDYDTEAQE